MDLQRTTSPSLNISTVITVLTYTYNSLPPIEVRARVSVGSQAAPIVGSGRYSLGFLLNGALLTPTSDVNVPAGVSRTVMASREVPLEQGDTVTITVVGMPADVAVFVDAILRDATPVHASDTSGGGARLIDHNYGGPDNLAVLSAAGAPIVDANIRAYRASDYSAGNTGNDFILAASITDSNGEWRTPIFLDPGSYTLLVYKNGFIVPRAIALSVT
jgi:hypothetical protein